VVKRLMTTLVTIVLAGCTGGTGATMGAGATPPASAPPASAPGTETATPSASPALLQPCPGEGPNGVALTTPLPGAFYQQSYRLDDQGSIIGQTLQVGRVGGPSWSVPLPPSGSAAGPFGRFVLALADDGSQTQLTLLDVADGCRIDLPAERSLVVQATIDPGRDLLYEVRYEVRPDRTTRAPTGIWRRPLLGTAAALVLPPPPTRPDGPGAESLLWSGDGEQLVIADCGATACRIRLLDPATDAVREAGDDTLGDPLGLSKDLLLAYGPCGDVTPCPIFALDLASSGGPRRIVEAAARARLASDLGPLLAYEANPDPWAPATVTIVDGSGRETASVPLPAGLHLLPGPIRGRAEVTSPPGWVPVAPLEQSLSTGLRFLHLTDGQLADPGRVPGP
jgi:hypothetical protein